MTQLLAPKRMTEAFEEMAAKKLKSLRPPKRESLLNENTPNIRGGQTPKSALPESSCDSDSDEEIFCGQVIK